MEHLHKEEPFSSDPYFRETPESAYMNISWNSLLEWVSCRWYRGKNVHALALSVTIFKIISIFYDHFYTYV